jgi:hypothetical protein
VIVVTVARRPLSAGTVASNVLDHGVGALNINGCRISSAPGDEVSNHSRGADSAVSKGIYGDSSAQETHQTAGQKLGRWPTNVILGHLPGCRDTCEAGCPVAKLDEQSGESKSSGFGGRTIVKRATSAERDGNRGPAYGAESRPEGAVMTSYDDVGGASRFFKQVQS